MLKMKNIISAVIFIAIVAFGIIYVVPYFTNQKYNFELQGVDKKVKLGDFRDKNVIIYFGYLSCPDACPTTMSAIKSVFKKLSIQERDSFKVIFISIDPDRDQPKAIESYAQYFIPNSVGLTGSSEELDKLEKPYRVYYVKDKSNSAMGYTVSHTSSIYFFKTRNRFFQRLSKYDDEEQIYKIIQEML